MSNPDSFIEEVTEEVRRDRLFALMRRYGWIAVVTVILIVGGAAYKEWQKARETAAAQALGDALLAALEQPDAEARVAALDGVAGAGDAAPLVGLLAAGEQSAAGQDEAAVARLRATGRQPASRTTGLGAAMLAGAALLGQQAVCPKRTLDISGDGTSNSGPRPREIRHDPALNGIVINGLVIGGWGAEGTPARRAELARLAAYFRAEVIRGPGAFVETAQGYADYEAAMVRKLLRELEGMNLSRLDQ